MGLLVHTEINDFSGGPRFIRVSLNSPGFLAVSLMTDALLLTNWSIRLAAGASVGWILDNMFESGNFCLFLVSTYFSRSMRYLGKLLLDCWGFRMRHTELIRDQNLVRVEVITGY